MLLLGIPLAHAATSEEGVAQQIQEIQAQLGETLLIGAVGPEAEKVAQRALREHPDLPAALVRIPSAGDLAREEAHALSAASLRCGARITPSGGAWTVTTFGDCSPASPLPVASLPPEEAAAQFQDQQLRLQPAAGGFSVYKGAGKPLHTTALATLLADASTRARLEEEQHRARMTARGFRIGGVALGASAVLPLIDMPPLYTAAGEDRIWSAVFLGSAGLMALIAPPWIEEGLEARQRQPALYYPEAALRSQVDRYNTDLQTTLGLLPREETPAVETPATETPPTETPPTDTPPTDTPKVEDEP